MTEKFEPVDDPITSVSAFYHSRFHFHTAVPAGETVPILSDDGKVLLTYRGFASVVPLVAMVVAVIVITTGVAAAAFLVAEGRELPAIIALVLSAGFSVLIAMLVPPVNVTIQEGTMPVVSIAQQSPVSFPVATYSVTTPERKVLARIRRSVWSRLGRNRWTILTPNENSPMGRAIEESLSRALIDKVAGKFNRRYQSNIVIDYLGKDVAWIIRRPNSEGESELLEVTGDIDRRVAVALATLVLGAEP